MATRKSFALRIDAKTLEAMQRWAKDDLRSLNAQIEYVLRGSLRKSGRLPKRADDASQTNGDSIE
ncbi:MAG: Arc family DNA binding domain-containing protein [Gammaproteobacteria bacterium]|nr:Arc family DNA binding domain-containing protein [Gammaproteobacteria bacterium]